MRVLLRVLLAWLGGAAPAAAATVFITGGTTWSVPADWNPNGAYAEAIGGGAQGGGAYANKSLTNVGASWTPGQLITLQVGSAGTYSGNAGDTCFVSCAILKAAGAHASAGGSAASSVGETTYGGGSGTCLSNFCPGGGAAGMHGAGNDGVNSTGGAGGSGDAGFGGAGTITGANGPGGDGTEWDGSHGSGGGGAGNYGGPNPGSAGRYGGGTSYGSFYGSGYQGLVVITYTPRHQIGGGVF